VITLGDRPLDLISGSRFFFEDDPKIESFYLAEEFLEHSEMGYY